VLSKHYWYFVILYRNYWYFLLFFTKSTDIFVVLYRKYRYLGYSIKRTEICVILKKDWYLICFIEKYWYLCCSIQVMARFSVIWSIFYMASVLVGEGAREWAKQHGVPVTSTGNLKTGEFHWSWYHPNLPLLYKSVWVRQSKPSFLFKLSKTVEPIFLVQTLASGHSGMHTDLTTLVKGPVL